jgi:hypothetical protein
MRKAEFDPEADNDVHPLAQLPEPARKRRTYPSNTKGY